MQKGIAALFSLFVLLAPGQPPAARTSFAGRVAELSEPSGYFDTDNLISNERSYLQVLPALRAAGVAGGAYIGVGPDQNFSYIARIRPAIAFIVDIRRDNLLLHLLFKAMFAEAPTRMDYLCLLFGRAPPARPAEWRTASIERLVAYVDATPASPGGAARARLEDRIRSFGVSLSAGDMATIGRFHQTFVDAGPGLKFESHGRSPRSYYPSYRDLLLETDPSGAQGNFLAADEPYQFVRGLEGRDLVIPVVGNFSGRTALAAIGRLIEERGETLTAFYTSNVEFYLFGDGSFPRFVDNLRRIPHAKNSVIIRSVFDGYAFRVAPGSYSASIVQPINDLLDRARAGAVSYRDLTISR
ncbi:MAG TPA: hypothetical protein VL309_02015 [Vicinamibacterales bacterium]|jgi:hypothetical protein|nr:hypothetical protein [Vicinamibacterales bacterium]